MAADAAADSTAAQSAASAEGVKVMIPNKNLAARITMPLITLSAYTEMLFHAGTISQKLWTAAIGSPWLIIGLWLLVVPAYLHFNDEKSRVTIIKMLRKIVVPYDQIERLEKRPSVFTRVYLKSGESFLFILEDESDYQLLAFNRPKIM